MKLPAGMSFDHLVVYSLRGSNKTRARVQLEGDLIRFTVSSKKFRLDATETNEVEYGLTRINAYSSTAKLFEGQTFSKDSITIMGTYETGFVQEITSGYEIDISQLNTNKAGDYIVKVTVGDKTTSIAIQVLPATPESETVELEEMPDVVVNPDGERNPYDHESDHDPVPTPSKKGCGGSIIASSILVSMMSLAALGLLVVRGKKED